MWLHNRHECPGYAVSGKRETAYRELRGSSRILNVFHTCIYGRTMRRLDSSCYRAKEPHSVHLAGINSTHLSRMALSLVQLFIPPRVLTPDKVFLGGVVIYNRLIFHQESLSVFATAALGPTVSSTSCPPTLVSHMHLLNLPLLWFTFCSCNKQYMCSFPGHFGPLLRPLFLIFGHINSPIQIRQRS